MYHFMIKSTKRNLCFSRVGSSEGQGILGPIVSNTCWTLLSLLVSLDPKWGQHTQCKDVRVHYRFQVGCDHQRCHRTSCTADQSVCLPWCRYNQHVQTMRGLMRGTFLCTWRSLPALVVCHSKQTVLVVDQSSMMVLDLVGVIVGLSQFTQPPMQWMSICKWWMSSIDFTGLYNSMSSAQRLSVLQPDRRMSETSPM